MLDKLEVLWDCLEEPMATRKKFRQMGYKQTSLDIITEELRRCKTIKQENVKLFVEKLRMQIVNQWDKIYRSEAERRKFTYLTSQHYTDDLLELHEIELEEAKRFHSENR